MEEQQLVIVEDNVSLREQLGLHFAELGYRTYLTDDAAQVLRFARRLKPLLVLSGDTTPNMDGMELLRNLKKIDREIPVILMSDGPSVRAAVRAIKEDAFDFIEKPVNPAELTNLVAQATRDRCCTAEPSNTDRIRHEIIYHAHRDYSLITLRGALDDAHTPGYQRELKALLTENTVLEKLILGFADVPLMNDTGLNLLLQMHDVWQSKGKRIALCDLPEPVRGFLETAGYDRFFTIEESLEEALRALADEKCKCAVPWRT